MSTNSLTPVIEILESLFSKLNDRFFESQLSKPVITISPSTKGENGWCTSWQAWTDSVNGYYEINLCAEYLSSPFTSLCKTLLHEMVHLYNLENDIKDTSRGGTYHNKRFKASAEQHGLICESSEKYGWNITTFTPESLAYVDTLDELDITLYRVKEEKEAKESKPKKSSLKYVCPECGNIVRATKELRIICKECDVEFELEE